MSSQAPAAVPNTTLQHEQQQGQAKKGPAYLKQHTHSEPLPDTRYVDAWLGTTMAGPPLPTPLPHLAMNPAAMMYPQAAVEAQAPYGSGSYHGAPQPIHPYTHAAAAAAAAAAATAANYHHAAGYGYVPRPQTQEYTPPLAMAAAPFGGMPMSVPGCVDDGSPVGPFNLYLHSNPSSAASTPTPVGWDVQLVEQMDHFSLGIQADAMMQRSAVAAAQAHRNQQYSSTSNHGNGNVRRNQNWQRPSPKSPQASRDSKLTTAAAPANAKESGERASELLLYTLKTIDPSQVAEFCDNKLRGNIVALSCSNTGSRFVQQALASRPAKAVERYFHEVLANDGLERLVFDTFGNYTMQKFLEHPIPYIRNKVLEAFEAKPREFAKHHHGCRVLQKIIEVCDAEGQKRVMKCLMKEIDLFAWHQNANHVIQKLIECMRIEDLAPIVKYTKGRVNELAQHVYGCRVVQRILNRMPRVLFETKDTSHPWMDDSSDGDGSSPETESDDTSWSGHFILHELIKEIVILIQDLYGNYVVQHALRNGTPNMVRCIVDSLLTRLAPQDFRALVCHRCASNAIELMLQFSDVDTQKRILAELFLLDGSRDGEGTSAERKSMFVKMATNPFGNYVVQRCMRMLAPEQRTIVFRSISSAIPSLYHNVYGKLVIVDLHMLMSMELKLTTEDEEDASSESAQDAQAAHLAERVRKGEVTLDSFEGDDDDSSDGLGMDE